MMQANKYSRVKNQNHYALAMEDALKRHEIALQLEVMTKE